MLQESKVHFMNFTKRN